MNARAAGAAGTSSPGLPLWLVCVLVFAALVTLLYLAFVLPAAGRRELLRRARLDEVRRYRLAGALGQHTALAVREDEVESGVSARALTVIDRAVRAGGRRPMLVSRLERSGLRLRPEEWVAIQVAAMLACAAGLAVLLASPLWLFPGAAVGWLVPAMYLQRKITKRAEQFTAQLPDSLQLLASGLRAGFALNHAVGSIVREGTEPSASEFGRVLAEVRLGADLEDALDSLATRMRSDDLLLVLMAVRTSREVGGNLAEILDNTVDTMRERVQLRGQVRVLSAEGRISAKVLIALPILMALYLRFFRGDYLRPMYTTGAGIALSVAGVVLACLGAFWLSKLIKIEV